MVVAYKLWHSFLPHLPRLTRYTLGTKIDALFLEVLEHIIIASYLKRDQKGTIILKASSRLDLLKFFLQLVWEMKVIDTKKYAAVSAPLIEVGKMLGGWQRQIEKILKPQKNFPLRGGKK